MENWLRIYNLEALIRSTNIYTNKREEEEKKKEGEQKKKKKRVVG